MCKLLELGTLQSSGKKEIDIPILKVVRFVKNSNSNWIDGDIDVSRFFVYRGSE